MANSIHILLRRALCAKQITGCVDGLLDMSYVQYQQIRKATNRYKLPPIPKVKEPRVSRKILGPKPLETPEMLDEDFLKKRPVDDVWLLKDYPVQKLSLESAIEKMRDLAQPAMLDNMQGMLHLHCDLDCSTKKKTKFLGPISGTVLLPHNFDDDTVNRLLVFCKDIEKQDAAFKMGAEFVGGIEMVKAVEKGEIQFGDFTHVICGADMITEIAVIRKFLRDQFPHESRGNLGGDVEGMVEYFLNCKNFISVKETEELGRLKLNVGHLDMPMEHLIANVNAYLEALTAHRPVSLGPFVKGGRLTCPPSVEVFELKPSELIAASQRTKDREDEDTDDED